MTYYILDENESIVLFDEDLGRLKASLALMPRYADSDIRETDRPIENFEFADTPEWREKQDEKARIARIEELEAFLDSTDWYAIRFADTGEPIPQNVKEQRQSAREEIARLRKK